MTETPLALPRLAPPGAGIPAIERLIGGAIFALRRWRGTRDRFAAQFGRERHAIAGLYQGRDERTLKQRILIPRLRGLEDSSRFWSVWMTLDHLRIVNAQITQVIDSLTQGRIPEGRASTAAVKPSPDVGPDVAGAYEASCDQLIAIAASRPTLQTPVRYTQPWFGPLDAAGWHAMAAMHMGIHRAQIARILADAPGKPS
jgi:hypothetical protein